jgi:hypothetical protein
MKTSTPSNANTITPTAIHIQVGLLFEEVSGLVGMGVGIAANVAVAVGLCVAVGMVVGTPDGVATAVSLWAGIWMLYPLPPLVEVACGEGCE